ncbi:MAG: metal-sensing transcriptional repressor [Parcubacteria group bacterium]|jgi:DNA-binding FrmR family transcriptional regulator
MEQQDKEILIALKKASTHLSKVIKMVEDKEYCIDILQQNLAVMGLLKSGNQKLMERHLHSCFANVMKSANEKRKQEMIEEILTINKMSK